MPYCRDPKIVKLLLFRNESATNSISNLVFGRAGGRALWVRVDDLEHPNAIVARSRALYFFAENRRAADKLLAELPRYKHVMFAATPSRLLGQVKKRRKVRWSASCYLYALEPGRLVIHRKHRIGTLTQADVPLVTRYWPHGKSRSYVAWRIRSGPTCAIRRKGKLVAWALTHHDGAMGLLHVLDEYRGLGMARSITTALAQRLLRAGLRPFMYIVKRNRPSLNLTASMGFTRVGKYCWCGW